jgi:hypothetical protein
MRKSQKKAARSTSSSQTRARTGSAAAGKHGVKAGVKARAKGAAASQRSTKPVAMAAAKGGSKNPPKPSKLASLKTLLLGDSPKKKPASRALGAPPAAKKTAAQAARHPATPKGKAPIAPAKGSLAKNVPTKSKAAPTKVAAAAPAKTAVASAKGGKAKAAEAAPAAKPAQVTKGKSAGANAAKALLKARALNGSGSRVEPSSEAVCREVACDGLATSAGYCRLHYIKNWKKIQRKAVILKEGKLNQYIEELVAKYPDKYIEAIRQDLANDKDFAKVIYDLDLDETIDEFDMEGENVDGLVDNIKPSFEDEGEGGF